MIIFALLTQNADFKKFVDDLQEVIQVRWERTADAIFLKLDECDGVLLDLDTNQKESDKLIKNIRKTHPDLPILVMANNLDQKKLAKHQKSITAPDLYFRYPTDIEVLKIMLSEFYEVTEEELTATGINLDEQQLLDEHEEAKEVSPAAKKTSNKMDDAFEDAFPSEFSELEQEQLQEKAIQDHETEAQPVEEELDELDLGEEFSMDDGSDEDSIDLGASDDDLMSLDSGDDDDLLSLGDDSEELVALNDQDGDSEVIDLDGNDDTLSLAAENDDTLMLEEENEDTLLLDGEEEEDETQLPSSEDLEFPIVEEITSSINLEMAGLENPVAPEDSIQEPEESPLETENEQSDVMGLSLDEEDGLEFDSPTSSSDHDLELGSGEELSLGDFDLSQAESDNSAIDLSAEAEGSVDQAESLDLSAVEDSGEISAIDLSLGDEKEEGTSTGLSLSEPEGGQDEMSAIDISLDDTGISSPEILSENDDVDESFDPFAEDDGAVSFLDDEDDEDSNDDLGAVGLSLGEESGEMQIERKEAPAEETLEAKKTAEVDSYMESEIQEEEIESSFTDEPTLVAGMIDENSEEVTGVTELSSSDETPIEDQFELPDSPPDFTATIQRKMQEIDAMVEEDATVVAEIPSAEQLAADDEEEPTQMYQMPSSDQLAETPDQNIDSDEDETKVYQAEDLVNELEQEKDDEVTVTSGISPSTSQSERVDQTTKQDYYEYVQNRDEELMRLGETIKSLRADRENLMDKIGEYEEKENLEKRDFLSLQAELDEKKIEVEILKKRYGKELDDLKFRLDMASEKKDVLTAKNRQYEAEFEKLRREKKVDLNRVRSRERELEERLELLKRDSEVQIRNRDQKILELKRRIDTLEFDIENAHMRERKKTSDNDLLENRLDKVIQTLRGVIGQLEDDTITDRQKLIKKNLDV